MISLAPYFEAATFSFAQDPRFQGLEQGVAPSADCDAFLANVCRVHLPSVRIMSFLYSLSAPAAAIALRHNLLEEMGLEDGEIPHSELLRPLAHRSGVPWETLVREADERIRSWIADATHPLGLRGIGLDALIEAVAYEWMLAHLSSRIGAFLQDHYGFRETEIIWYAHHSEADIRHAEQGLDAILAYAQHHRLSPAQLTESLARVLNARLFASAYFASRPQPPV
jgi:pyrroloquinoline quinone (PQQ) biosynthesis protein C